MTTVCRNSRHVIGPATGTSAPLETYTFADSPSSEWSPNARQLSLQLGWHHLPVPDASTRVRTMLFSTRLFMDTALIHLN